MLKFITFTLALSLSQSLFAEGPRILVSDIDDTIKVSHVLDKDSTVANAFTRKNAFLGMPELYQALKAEGRIDRVLYLSNAPVWLMYPFHKKFLKRTGFPVDGLLLRKDIRDSDHKVNALRQLIRTAQPSELVLIGDNGEEDTTKYAKIAKEFPDLKITTFIHLAYSQRGFKGSIGKPLESEQIPFATSLDLGAKLLEQEFLSPKAYESLIEYVTPIALSESDYVERGKQMIFPAWFDCRDFSLEPLPVTSSAQENLVQAIEERIRNRCARQPFED